MKAKLIFRSEFSSHFFERSIRFILPIVVISAAKFAGAIIVAGNPFFGYWSEKWSADGWWLVFTGWDTGYYAKIASLWYPPNLDPLWAFFPFFPSSARLISIFMNNPYEAVVIVSLIFGVAWVPLFQLVAENYMNCDDAFWCTLLTAFFPTVFLFTTVAYTEPLFLFACLATWLCYLKGKMPQSIIFAAVATLTRNYGIAIIIPIALDLLRKRKGRKMVWMAFPVLALASWWYYFVMSTGRLWLLEPVYRFWPQKSWLFYLGILSGAKISDYWLIGDPFKLCFVALFFCLAFWIWKVDWRLATYTLILSSAILANTTLWGLTRYLTFLFPAWLNLKFKNPIVSLILIIFFYLNALVLWVVFTGGSWVS